MRVAKGSKKGVKGTILILHLKLSTVITNVPHSTILLYFDQLNDIQTCSTEGYRSVVFVPNAANRVAYSTQYTAGRELPNKNDK